MCSRNLESQMRMQRIKSALLWLAVAAFVLLPILAAFAANPRAEAAVAVSVSRVRAAQSNHADLPNDFKQSAGIDPRDYSMALMQVAELEADNADLRRERANLSQNLRAMKDKEAAPQAVAPQKQNAASDSDRARLSTPHRVLIGTSKNCMPCRVFKNQNGTGNYQLELVYVDIDGTKPGDVSQEEWDRLQATVTGLYATVEPQDKMLPCAMWQASSGSWYSKGVAGWRITELQKWVN